MIVGIVGSRRRNEQSDKDLIEKELVKILDETKDVIICSGGCPKCGDKFAEQLALKYRLTKKIYSADWNKHGRIAGFLRNSTIAETSDILIATPSKDRTGGTEDTIKKFKKSHPLTWEKDLILV